MFSFREASGLSLSYQAREIALVAWLRSRQWRRDGICMRWKLTRQEPIPDGD